jgi:DNA-binding response OmpR family regulator
MAATRARRILVVDDNPEIVKLIAARLEQEGYAIQTASTGEEALQLLDKSVPDLVLLDVSMPGISGFEVCTKIKATARLRELLVVLVTARDSVADKVQGLELGADEYITKPVRMAELSARLKALFRLRRLEDELKLANQKLKKYVVALNDANKKRAKLIRRLQEQNARLERHLAGEREFLGLLTDVLKGPVRRLGQVAAGAQGGGDNGLVKVIQTESKRLQGILERLPTYLERIMGPTDRRRGADRRKGASSYTGPERRKGERRQQDRRGTDQARKLAAARVT